MRRVVLALSLVGLLSSSCAPSLRMVHQSNVYFERCYAAEFDDRYRTREREACWTAWLDHYTTGQPMHRVDFAMGRLEASARGESMMALPSSSPRAEVDEHPFGTEGGQSSSGEPLGQPQPPQSATPSSAGSEAPVVAEVVTTSDAAPNLPATTISLPAPPASSVDGVRHPAPRPVAVRSDVCAHVCAPSYDLCVDRCDTSDDGPACRATCMIQRRTCVAACP